MSPREDKLNRRVSLLELNCWFNKLLAPSQNSDTAVKFLGLEVAGCGERDKPC